MARIEQARPDDKENELNHLKSFFRVDPSAREYFVAALKKSSEHLEGYDSKDIWRVLEEWGRKPPDPFVAPEIR